MLSQKQLSIELDVALWELEEEKPPTLCGTMIADRVLRSLPAAAEERERIEWFAEYALWRKYGLHTEPPPIFSND